MNLPEGQYTIRVEASSGKGNSAIERAVTLKRSFKVLLTTDKPIYQPGQTIHIRSLTLATADMRPPVGRDMVIEVKDAKGLKSKELTKLRVNERVDAFILRTDKVIYKTGETAKISIHSPASLSGVVFLDVIKDRQTRLTKSVEIQKGLGQVALDLPPDLFGTVEIHGYRIMTDGNIAGESKVIQINRAGRGIALWWILAFYLTLAGSVVGASVFPDNRGISAAAFASAVALIMSVGMMVRIIRFRENPVFFAIPILRKLLTGLIFCPALAVVAFLAMVAALESHREGVLTEKIAPCSMVALIVIAPLFTASILTAFRSVSRKISFPMLAAGFVIRIVWFGSPILLAGLLSPALSRARESARPAQAGTGLNEARQVDAMGVEFEMTAAAPPGAPSADDGGNVFFSGGHAGFKVLATTKSAEAHDRKEGENEESVTQPPPRIRKHFPETLLWVPELITDPSGKARLEIPLADSITTWRLGMSAISSRGELGSGTLPLRVFQDFFVDIDFPVALTQHDRVTVPVAIYNYLAKPQSIRLEIEEGPWFQFVGSPRQTIEVKAGEVTRASITLEALRPGRQTLTVKAYGSEMSDAVERSVQVEPDGRAVVQTINGELRENLTREIIIPKDAIEGASDLFVKIYPGAFSQVIEGLDNIFQMPNGCFEQTSSTTYPNILVLDYMRRAKQNKPAIEMKALNFINLGHQRLLSFEVKGGGFEWFGQAPAHNVLTAYGLMEFADMARVFEVDPEVIKRTRAWLLAQQDADGLFTPSKGGIGEGAINQFQGQTLRTTAYIAWALAEAKGANTMEPQVQRALDYVAEKAGKETDPYALALCANALASGGHPRMQSVLKQGKNLVALETSGEGNMAYQIVATHYLPWGMKSVSSEPDKELTIHLDYNTTNLKKDDVLECQVKIAYNRPGLARMTIVDLGIPPGFEALADNLEALKDKGVIERFSVTGRQAILYIRQIESGKPLTFSFKLKAKFPVKAKTPQSRVYQYYEPEVRDVAPPVDLTVL